MTGSFEFDVLVFVVTLVFSGFFSASETALTALPEAKARRLVDASRKNRLLQLWLDRPNRVLTTILIGNNIVNTFAGVLATLISQNVFGSSVIAVATGLTTVALLIVGEITPKTFAKHNAEKLAPLVMPLIFFLYYATFPVVVLFTEMSRVLVRISGGQVSRSGPFITEDDIAFMVQLGQQEGVLEEHEEKLISSVLEFGDTVVREIMVPRTAVVGISLDSTLDEVLEVVKEGGHSRMPVYEESIDDVRGLFYAKDLLDVLTSGDKSFDIKKYLKEPFFVPELMKISELLKEFQRRKVHVAVVVDEYGGTAGLISLEDIIEEIVGEIEDEYDEEGEAELQKIDDDFYFALGKTSIYDVGEALNVEFPEDGPYETVGGFLIATSGKMPMAGERVTFAGWSFVVAEADDRRVAKVEIKRSNGVDDGSSSSSGDSSREPMVANG